jgi:hypothetical protein
MTESQWLECSDPERMVALVESRVTVTCVSFSPRVVQRPSQILTRGLRGGLIGMNPSHRHPSSFFPAIGRTRSRTVTLPDTALNHASFTAATTGLNPVGVNNTGLPTLLAARIAFQAELASSSTTFFFASSSPRAAAFLYHTSASFTSFFTPMPCSYMRPR